MRPFIKKIIKYICTGIAGICLLVGLISPPKEIRAEQSWPTGPGILAKTAVLMEASTGSVLYEKEAETKMYPASTTKLMTALLAIEQGRMTDVVEMSYDSTHSMGWDASRIGVNDGEKIPMEGALYAILLASANEVTYAVAEHIGNGDIDRFTEMMNKRAGELGCVNSHFSNPHGLHENDHYSCAYDLALIMKKCVEYPAFIRISNNRSYVLHSIEPDVSRPMAQTHKILHKDISYEGVFAGKTGYTQEAGNCLVTAAERNGMTLICVVMGEVGKDDCYTDTMSLFDYGFNNFSLINPGAKEASVNAFPALFDDEIAFLKKEKTELSITETSVVLPKDASFFDVTNKCTLNPLLEILKGENIIGEVSYFYAGRNIGQAQIIYTADSDRIVDMAGLYYEEYKDTEEFNEEQYKYLAGEIPEEIPPDMRPAIIGYACGLIVFILGFSVLLIVYIKTRR